MVLSKRSLKKPHKLAATSYAHAKDISEHVSSVGRFYADFDEFDLSELAPPQGPKQHWWDKDYTPYLEDGHKVKLCSLSDLTGDSSSPSTSSRPKTQRSLSNSNSNPNFNSNFNVTANSSLSDGIATVESAKDIEVADSVDLAQKGEWAKGSTSTYVPEYDSRDNESRGNGESISNRETETELSLNREFLNSEAEQSYNPTSLDDSDFDESLLTPVVSFNPHAYRARKKHQHLHRYNGQDLTKDIKSARDLVSQESYQERLRQHQQQKYGDAFEVVAHTMSLGSSTKVNTHNELAENSEASDTITSNVKSLQAVTTTDHKGLIGQDSSLERSSNFKSQSTSDLSCSTRVLPHATSALAPSSNTSLYAQEVTLHNRLHKTQHTPEGQISTVGIKGARAIGDIGDKTEWSEDTQHNLAKLSYAQTVALQRAHNQELKEQQAEQKAQAAITPWNTKGDQYLRLKKANSAQTRLLQRHGGLATQEGQEHNPFYKLSSRESTLGLAFNGTTKIQQLDSSYHELALDNLNMAGQVKTDSNHTATLVVDSVPNSTKASTTNPVSRATLAHSHGKVPYRNYFAQQNVFGSSSEDSEQSSTMRSYSLLNSRSGKRSGSSCDCNDSSGTNITNSNKSNSIRFGRNRVNSKKSQQVIDYDDISSGVSGIGLSSSSLDITKANDLEESTSSFGSFSGNESSSRKGGNKGMGRYSRYGSKTRSNRGKVVATSSESEDALSISSGQESEISKLGKATFEHTTLEASAHLGAGADTLDSTNDRGKGQQSELARAYNYMIQLLTRREYSQEEIRQKVKGRFSDKAVEAALQRCVEYGYQSDTRHAEMLIRHMEFSGYGPQKLWLEARRKGADDDEIKRLSAEVDWDDIAYQALCRKFSAEQVADYTTRNKALAYLARRGFSSSSSYTAIERLQKDAEND